MTHLTKKEGFSLVELMIVLVIVGILAAIAVPIYTNQAKKARMGEADAALGTIRTQLRVYYGENGSYPATTEDVVGASWNDIATGELEGKYFQDASYTYAGTDSTYEITCDAGDVLNFDRVMNQGGELSGGISE
ncbi:MAG: prepilin-type N-terminal cleavage/methylation domain-containing protein [Nitrososphaerales archaeon]